MGTIKSSLHCSQWAVILLTQHFCCLYGALFCMQRSFFRLLEQFSIVLVLMFFFLVFKDASECRLFYICLFSPIYTCKVSQSFMAVEILHTINLVGENFLYFFNVCISFIVGILKHNTQYSFQSYF